jgi:hypothetical protein
MGPAYTTTNTRKRKSKVPASKYAQDWVDYNKQMKKLGVKTKTYEEYVEYRQGKFKPKLRGTPMPTAYKSDHREKYKSVDGVGVTFAKKPNEYTGTLIKGIATMHKSNAVPVINQDQMEEISRMRRG